MEDLERERERERETGGMEDLDLFVAIAHSVFATSSVSFDHFDAFGIVAKRNQKHRHASISCFDSELVLPHHHYYFSIRTRTEREGERERERGHQGRLMA